MEPPQKESVENETLPVLTFNEQTCHTRNTLENKDIQCIKCELFYEFPADKDNYLAHLFMEHRLVIADVEDIALLEDYLETWQKSFQGHELEEYCTTMLLDQLPDGTSSKNEKYYLLSDILPKDFELRRTLHQKRLEMALKQHQFERTDRSFCKECLYCRDVITGVRADYLGHLFEKHFLQLGKPENLVYVDELLEKVQTNLEKLICLYCEKIFKDRVTLKEHMRKKAHKRINPNNREYDKFFLLNYRNEKTQQPSRSRHGHGRNQPRTQHQEGLTAHVPKQKETINSSNQDEDLFERRLGRSDSSDSDWSDWDDDTEKLPPLNCLFCTHRELNFEELKEHMKIEHNVDFDKEVKDLNFYQKIKIVNYVRRQICLLRCVACNMRCESKETLLEHMSVEEHYTLGAQKQWDKPEFFFPTYEDDGVLCILDDNPNDDINDTAVRIFSEDTIGQINKDAERLSLENFKFP